MASWPDGPKYIREDATGDGLRFAKLANREKLVRCVRALRLFTFGSSQWSIIEALANLKDEEGARSAQSKIPRRNCI